MGDLWKYKAIAEIKARQEEARNKMKNKDNDYESIIPIRDERVPVTTDQNITLKTGQKWQGDKKIYWHGYPVEYPELATIVLYMTNNEKNGYRPMEGVLRDVYLYIEDKRIESKEQGHPLGDLRLIQFMIQVMLNTRVNLELLELYKLANFRPTEKI